MELVLSAISLYSNANSRNIDKLVDQYTALIGAVADAINDRNANRDSVYGIITERMSEEISARISSSGTVSVCFYRKSNNKARLVWHNEIINRTLRKKITYTSDEMTHENHSNSYVHEKIFSRTDDITLLYQRDIFKKFPKIDKTLKKRMKSFLSRTLKTQIADNDVAYCVEIIVYDGSNVISPKLAEQVVCDVIDPMLDVCRIVDCYYGGDF